MLIKAIIGLGKKWCEGAALRILLKVESVLVGMLVTTGIAGTVMFFNRVIVEKSGKETLKFWVDKLKEFTVEDTKKLEEESPDTEYLGEESDSAPPY